MADRAANRDGVGTRLAQFARSLVLLVVIAVGVPWALLFAARERFGGGAPFHGVPAPSDWSASRIREALTERLTDQTIADIVIRAALVVAWVGVIVIVLTVVAEVVHMLRHDGLSLPDLRGLGMTQRTARVIASGLLVIIPLFTSPASAIARPGSAPMPERSVASVLAAPETDAASAPVSSRSAAGRSEQTPSTDVADVVRDVRADRYVVQPGDSIFGIAERMAGPDPSRVAEFAEQLVDLNLGRQMPDGRHFDNAAFIDVGWLLDLPDAAATSTPIETADVHVVERGESLWSIADDELGDPTRWPEVYEANAGRAFEDGRRLVDPDLIQPGWDLRVPGHQQTDDAVAVEPVTEMSEVDSLADVPPATPSVEEVVLDRLAASIDPDGAPNADVAEIAEVSGAGAGVGGAEADVAAAPARRTNVWAGVDGVVGAEVSAAARGTATDDGGPEEEQDDSTVPGLLMLGGAAMLSAGVLTLLAVRRRNQLRRSRPRTMLSRPAPRPAATERRLRAIDTGERFIRVETAVRAAAVPLVEHGARVLAVLVGPDGALELRATGAVEPPGPWEGEPGRWRLAASTPLELLAETARPISPPCPALVQLGSDDLGRDVYVDLEAVEAIEIGGPGAHADAIVAAVAATLAGSLLAEVTTLVGVGVPDDAFLGHRRYVPVRDGRRAFEAAADAIGSTASMATTTFELRASGTATETWEPAVVLVGAAAGTIDVPTSRNGLAVVSAAPIHGPSSRLAPDGDAWLLQPAGIRLTPVGLTPDDISAVAELVTVIDPEPMTEPSPSAPPTVALDPAARPSDHTLVSPDRDGPTIDEEAASRAEPVVAAPPPPYELLVRMLGPVEVVDRSGAPVAFERSKTRELVAWLATHRDRSTRTAARTALWELDVRDATFANVVSEARRSLARLVEPPTGEEWVGRTMTDALPLHELVLSDADVIRHALDAARVEPPAQAIATLTPAVELIVGMPFEGTGYLWSDSEGITSDLVLLATTATMELAAHCLSLGDIEGVFRATGRGLQVLPAHEELIGLRMEAHARAGDHAGVRQEWESYERVINGDPWSDGEPAPKLVELRQRLLHPTR